MPPDDNVNDDATQVVEPDDAEPTAADQASDDQGDDGEDFDKERALATIRKLRQFEKQAKALKRELDEIKREREEAGKTELEKLSSRLAEEERKALDAEARVAAAEVRADFVEKALREGVTNLQLAYLAAQADGLLGSYDDGEVSDHDFKTLKKRYPDLFRTTTGSADGSAGNETPPVSGGMNDFIRRAAGR